MRTMVASVLLVGVAVMSWPVVTQAADLQMRTGTALQTLLLSPLKRQQEFQGVLKQHNVGRQEQTKAVERFRSLPGDLQDSILAVVSADYARLTLRDDYVLRPELVRVRGDLLLLFYISSIWPSEGSPGAWAYAFGANLNDNCQVYFNGSPVETHYLDWSFEFFPRSLAFVIPAGAARGVEHSVFVRNTATSKDTATVAYKVIAPRGYRGMWGWKFHNFSDPTIPWHLYSNYFGAAAVEYGDGTHRPAAQAWYDSAYKGAGNGGNCYGMSVSSLRVRNDNFSHMFHATWLNDPANYHDWLWHYSWVTQTKETVQQMQGSWYTQEQLDAYVAADAAQDARGTYNRVASLVSESVNRPVLVYWGPGWGHAVVPYAVRVNGDAREMLCYDNNNPYRENETGDPDPSIATVNWAANTFTCGTANSATCVSYNEVTPANPHLPGAEYGGPGAATVVLVASADTKVQQITDENGKTLLRPDGTKNQDPNTAIPNASVLYPLVQDPRLQGPTVLQGQLLTGLQAPPRIPDDSPTLFVFGSATGKSLRVTFAGQGEKQLGYFQPGTVMQAKANGAGEVQLSNILQARFTTQVLNPAALQLTEVQLIDSRTAGDRVFILRGLSGLDAQALGLTRVQRGEGIEVAGGPNLKFDLQLQGPAGRSMRVGNFRGVALQAGAKVQIAPVDWTQLRNTELNIRLLNVNNDQLIQQIRLGGGNQ